MSEEQDKRATLTGESPLQSLARALTSFATRDDPAPPPQPTLKNSIDSSDATPPLPDPPKRAIGRRQWETWLVNAGIGGTGTIEAGAQPDHWIIYPIAVTGTVRIVHGDTPPQGLPTADGIYPAFGVVLTSGRAVTIPGRGRSIAWINETAVSDFGVIAVTNLTAGTE